MKYHSVKPCHQFIKCETKLGLLTPGSLIFSHMVQFFISTGRADLGTVLSNRRQIKVPIVGTQNENVLVV